MDDGAPTAQDYLALIREMLEDWQQVNQRSEVEVRRGRTVVDYPVLHGLTAHVHRMAAATLALAEVGMLTEALPNVRSAYECAVTAAWASHFDDSVIAIGKSSARRRRQVIEEIQKLDPSRLDAAGNITATEALEAMESSVTGKAGNFKAVCGDIVGGDAAYVQYRIFSSLVHATLSCAEQYLVGVDGDLRLHLSLKPKHDLDRAAAVLLLGCMVWSRQALLAHERKVGAQGKLLRSVADRGQVRLKLELTQEAWVIRERAKAEKKGARRG
jgi:hypothetical protein